MSDLFKKKFGTKPIPLRMDVTDIGIRSESFSFIFEMTEERKPIYQFCRSKCNQQECEQAVYVSRIKSLINLNENDDQEYDVLFSLPTSPVVVCVSQPAITIEGFVTDIFSTIGFWLGFSIMGLLEWVHDSFLTVGRFIGLIPERKTKSRKKKKRMHNNRRISSERNCDNRLGEVTFLRESRSAVTYTGHVLKRRCSHSLTRATVRW
jgi:hypothetical protein